MDSNEKLEMEMKMGLSNYFKKSTLTLIMTAVFAVGGVAGCAQTNAQPGHSTQASEGSRISGELTSRSNVNMNDGSRYERSTVHLTANTVMLFTLKSSFEGRMTLLNRQGMVVASTSNAGNNVTLAYEVEEGGSYTLAVSGNSSNNYGPYEVFMQTMSVRNSGEVTAGTEIYGILTSQNRGNVYQLNVSSAGLYSIDLMSDEFDAYLELSGPNGVNLTDDDSGDGRNARIRAYLEPGSYQLRAKGYGSTAATGPYTLAVATEQIPEGLQNNGPLTLGSTVTGLLLSSGNTYQLEITTEGFYELNMMSDDLDSVLVLSGNGINIENDDGGSGLNARIVGQLTPGTYTIQARGYRSATGIFTLSAVHKEMPANLQLGGSMALNTPITGYYNGQDLVYTINVPRRSRVTVDLMSSDFDAFLRLEGQGVSEENDDGGSGLDSRISRVLEPGRYTLTARSYNRNSAGLFTLQAYTQPVSR